MYFAKIKSCVDGHTDSVLFERSYNDMLDGMRAAKAVFLFCLPLVVRGHSYQERKNSLRDLAIDFQYNNDGETDIQLSMYEIGVIEHFFERMGRKYGLLREFRENAIC